MKALAACVLVVAFGSGAVLAQERDRSIERLAIALQQDPVLGLRGAVPDESTTPRTFGIFTLVEPELRGEIVRVSVPVGDLTMRAIRGVAAARHRREEAAARRRVDAELERFLALTAAPR